MLFNRRAGRHRTSQPFDDFDAGQFGSVDRRDVVGVFAGLRRVTDAAIICITELAVYIATDADALEQGVSRGVAKGGSCSNTTSFRLAISPRAAEWSCSNMLASAVNSSSRSSSPKPVRSASFAEMKPWRGRDRTARCATAHCAVVRAVDAVVALGLLLLFGFIGGGHARDGYFLRHDGLN